MKTPPVCFLCGTVQQHDKKKGLDLDFAAKLKYDDILVIFV